MSRTLAAVQFMQAETERVVQALDQQLGAWGLVEAGGGGADFRVIVGDSRTGWVAVGGDLEIVDGLAAALSAAVRGWAVLTTVERSSSLELSLLHDGVVIDHVVLGGDPQLGMAPLRTPRDEWGAVLGPLAESDHFVDVLCAPCAVREQTLGRLVAEAAWPAVVMHSDNRGLLPAGLQARDFTYRSPPPWRAVTHGSVMLDAAGMKGVRHLQGEEGRMEFPAIATVRNIGGPLEGLRVKITGGAERDGLMRPTDVIVSRPVRGTLERCTSQEPVVNDDGVEFDLPEVTAPAGLLATDPNEIHTWERPLHVEERLRRELSIGVVCEGASPGHGTFAIEVHPLTKSGSSHITYCDLVVLAR